MGTQVGDGIVGRVDKRVGEAGCALRCHLRGGNVAAGAETIPLAEKLGPLSGRASYVDRWTGECRRAYAGPSVPRDLSWMGVRHVVDDRLHSPLLVRCLWRCEVARRYDAH